MVTRYFLTGFWHLTGQTVKVLIDGALHPDCVVDANGMIELDSIIGAAATANQQAVGLQYNQDIETLPPAWEGIEALGQGKEKNVSKVFAHVVKTTAIKAGPTFDSLREYPPRTNEDYNTPARAKSQYIEVPIDPEWDVDATVCIRNEDPLPVQITGLVLELEI